MHIHIYIYKYIYHLESNHAAILEEIFLAIFSHRNLVHAGRKLNAQRMFRRSPGRLLNVLCAVNLRPVSRGK